MLEYGEILCNIYKRIENDYAQILICKQLRKTLLPRLLSGEIRLD